MNKRLILGIISISLIAIGTIGLIWMTIDNKLDVTLNAQGCEMVFDCTPQEFFDLDLDLYNQTKDFRKSAYINKYGELVIPLTQNQINVWLKSLQQEAYNIENQYNIDIADDFSELTIYGYKETVYLDFNVAAKFSYKMALIRILNNVANPYKYKVTLKDGITGEIVWNTYRPSGKLEEINEVVYEYYFKNTPEESE